MSFHTLVFRTKEEWLAERTKSVGASEVAILTGDNPYDRGGREGLLHQYLTGESKNLDDNVRVQCGVLLESYCLQLIAESLPGATVMAPSHKWTICRRDDDPLIHWSPDGYVFRNSIMCPAECKATGLVKEWANGSYPAIYGAQCQVANYVTDAPCAYLGALVGFKDFVLRDVKRDNEWIERAVDLCQAFMREVQQCRK